MSSLNKTDNDKNEIDDNNNENKKDASNPNSNDDISSEDILVLPESKLNHDLCFKIIIIGDSAVGKTSLVHQGVFEKFNPNYQSTVGLDFSTMYLKIEQKIIKLQIWDTCGQEAYRSLIKNFYRNASLALMVYSIDNKESFADIDLWIKELKSCSNPDSKMFLIGNKNDLENRQVTTEKGKNFAKSYGFVGFLETSAKTGFNAREIFIKSAQILYNDYKNYESNLQSSDSFSSYVKSESSRRIRKKESKSAGCCY